jgi:anti-anti-sigma factor
MSYPLGPPRPHPPLSLRSQLAPGRVRVEAAGEMDLASTPMVMAVIDAVVRVHRPNVVELDLTSLSFLSRCAVTPLVNARNRLLATGRRLEVTHPHGAVLRMLTLTDAWDILQAPAPRHTVHLSATRAVDDRWLLNRQRDRYPTDERTRP